MKQVDYLIIGGGAAGTTAAETIRTNDPKGSIIIVTEEPEPLYSRVLLPLYLEGQIPLEKLYLRTNQQYQEKLINLIKNVKANKVGTQNRKVLLSDGQEISYKKLLIASGGKAKHLDVPGSNLLGVTYLRTLTDANEIKDLVGKAQSAVVIGGWFVGLDFARIFRKANLATTCVTRGSGFGSRQVGENIGKLINLILEKNGVKLITQDQVREFVGKNQLEKVILESDQEIAAEIAGIGVGIALNTDYLDGSGIKINEGVVTNEYLETDTRDIWAAGDIAEFYDVIFGKQYKMGNWSNAVMQGKIAGQNMVAGWGGKGREQFMAVSAYIMPFFEANLSLIGDTSTDEKIEIIELGSVADGRMGRFYLRDGIIVGAALINFPADRVPIEELIKKRVKIRDNKNKLADPKFDLNSLL